MKINKSTPYPARQQKQSSVLSSRSGLEARVQSLRFKMSSGGKPEPPLRCSPILFKSCGFRAATPAGWRLVQRNGQRKKTFEEAGGVLFQLGYLRNSWGEGCNLHIPVSMGGDEMRLYLGGMFQEQTFAGNIPAPYKGAPGLGLVDLLSV